MGHLLGGEKINFLIRGAEVASRAGIKIFFGGLITFGRGRFASQYSLSLLSSIMFFVTIGNWGRQ